MSYKSNIIHIVSFLLIIILSVNSCTACKDIIATGDATAGDYNFLMKVRDPSRPGLQVLVHIPKGYEYTYHHPWTGKPMDFRVQNSYIGVTSEQDMLPHIVKSGMVLTTAGLAFGDADSLSRWINPTRFAWDDFDWIRYSAEQAGTESEAIHLLTDKAVNQLHAPGVSENMCLVGPEKGYMIEADAYRYTVKEIVDDVDVISNYPRKLWDTQIIRSRFIADEYNASVTDTVTERECVHLNSIARIKILNITQNEIKVRQIPFFTNIGYHDGKPTFLMPSVTISLGENKTVGDFYLSLKNISDNKATIYLTTAVHAWEQTLLKRIVPKKGTITVEDLMNWSRIQAKDVPDVRPMCEEAYPYEGVAIYQIPKKQFQIASKGWFSANHACSSIYVPFHSSNTEIDKAYKTSEAAKISYDLYQNYSDSLLHLIKSIEEVFLTENNVFDRWIHKSIHQEKIQINVLTSVDTTMQKQAWIMQKLFHDISKLEKKQQHTLFNYSKQLWCDNYSTTMISMGSILNQTNSIENISFFNKAVMQLMETTCNCFINITQTIGHSTEKLVDTYHQAIQLLDQNQYNKAANLFQHILIQCRSYFICPS